MDRLFTSYVDQHLLQSLQLSSPTMELVPKLKSPSNTLYWYRRYTIKKCKGNLKRLSLRAQTLQLSSKFSTQNPKRAKYVFLVLRKIIDTGQGQHRIGPNVDTLALSADKKIQGHAFWHLNLSFMRGSTRAATLGFMLRFFVVDFRRWDHHRLNVFFWSGILSSKDALAKFSPSNSIFGSNFCTKAPNAPISKFPPILETTSKWKN